MTSLRNRLTLSLSLLLLATGALLAFALQHFPRDLVEGYVLSRLEHDADLLYTQLRDAPDPEQVAVRAAGGTIYHLPLSGHYFRVTHAGSKLLSRSLWDTELGFAPGGDGVSRQPGPAGQKLLVYTRTYPGAGHPAAGDPGAGHPAAVEHAPPWIVEVAEDISEMDVAIAAFRRTLLGAGALALLLLAWTQRGLLVRGLAPLDEAVAACRRLERGESVPIATDAPAEVKPMLDAVNRLVRHQGSRLARIRHAAGNLSHALKTPLAALGQVADEAAEAGDVALAESLRGPIETMRATIERELRRARLAGSGPTADGFDPAAQLPALAEGLERLYRDRGIAIELDVEPGRLPLDREDMLELFGNLLDNGCKWARSRVRLAVATNGRDLRGGAGLGDDVLRFCVEDDGRGVRDDLLAQLGRAGFRVDEARPGSGVGLSIVADIVAQYEGAIVYGRSDSLGGLRAEGRLPIAPAESSP